MTLGMLRLPDHVHYGAGSRASLGPAAATLGSRAFVVVDGALRASPEFAAALDDLARAGVTTTVHDDVVPELPVDAVEAVAERARAADPDLVIGWGGGSALDLAKLVALLLRHPAPLSLYYGENAVPGPALPVIAVPTTAGTGSEVTPIAVIADPGRELKVGISDAALVPRFAIVDPELSAGAPRGVTAYAGVDALVHAVESLTSAHREPAWGERMPIFVGANPLDSLLALEAIRAIGPNLPDAVDGDRAARERMAWGSMLAGMAFGSSGTHLSHAIQYPLGALTHTPHGLGTGMLLPHVLRAVLPAVVEPLARAAEALGVVPAAGSGAARVSDEARARAAIDRIAGIVAAIGLPASLAEMGVARAQLPRIRELSLGVTRLAANAPVPAASVIDEILESAFTGS